MAIRGNHTQGVLFAASKIFATLRTKKAALIQRGLVFAGIIAVVVAGMTVHAYQGSQKTSASNNSSPQANHAPTLAVSGADQAPPPLTKDDFAPVIHEAKNSVVKIEGYGCGDYIFQGTGFVVGPDLVATNAHVVAGVSSVYVNDSNGRHVAVPVWFDPVLDFAILRVSNLAGKPLPLRISNSGVSVAGTHNDERNIFLGYPNGGDFAAELATIRDEFITNTTNFYGNPVEIHLLELIANVAPGNSGSPLIGPDGYVTGLVSAHSKVEAGIGFALPTNAFFDKVQQAKQLHNRVSTQTCTLL